MNTITLPFARVQVAGAEIADEATVTLTGAELNALVNAYASRAAQSVAELYHRAIQDHLETAALTELVAAVDRQTAAIRAPRVRATEMTKDGQGRTTGAFSREALQSDAAKP